MIIRTVQWNIGGGKVRDSGDDPCDVLSYRIDALDQIIDKLKQIDADIITLQESHTADNLIQAAVIADRLNLKYFANDVYDRSHLEEDQALSQTIISKYPITKHQFTLFYNPRFETTGPRGEHWVSHDKGVTSCLIDIGGSELLNVKTSHSFPFRRFKIDPMDERALALRQDMAEKIKPEAKKFIYQGDLNYDDYSVRNFLIGLIDNGGLEEVILARPTTPKGRKYDHILYRGFDHIQSLVVNDVLTDHFPVLTEFKIIE